MLVDNWNTINKRERIDRLKSLLGLSNEIAQKGAETVSGFAAYASSGNLRGWLRTFALYQVAATRIKAWRQKPPAAH